MRRFNSIKKSRKKSKDIDEKIEYLNKECQKTGLNEIMNTTGMYQGATKVPNQDFVDFEGKSQGGYGFGMSGGDGNGAGGASVDVVDNTVVNCGSHIGLAGVAISPPHPVTGQRRCARTITNATGSGSPLRPGTMQGMSAPSGGALWFFDPNADNGLGRWRNFQWHTSQNAWGFWDTNFLGFFYLNTNLDQFTLNGNNIGTDIKNKIADINFGANGSLGEPQTTVLTKNDLGDSRFIPIDIMSPEAFDILLNKAKKDKIAAEYPRKDPLDRMIDFLDKDIKNKPWPGKDPEDPFKFSQGHQTSSYNPDGDLLSEAIKLGHFEPEVLNVDINDIRKGIMPEFPKDPPPEMIGGYSAKSRLVRKDPEFPPFINVTRKDLARNHKLTDKEITQYMNDIKLINDYIKKNPAELVYAMTRYPKDDPRLAQLNFKIDQMKAASDEYMDTHFPENQKLFSKLQDKIIRNINQTDPKNFTGHKDAPKFVETDINEEERRRKTIARHFKKKK